MRSLLPEQRHVNDHALIEGAISTNFVTSGKPFAWPITCPLITQTPAPPHLLRLRRHLPA